MTARSTRVRIRVVPGASRSMVVGRYGDGWKLRVAAAPERGKANDAVVTLLAETCGLARPAVRLVAGQSTRDKLIELDGVTLEEAERLLEQAEEPKEAP